MTDTTSIEYLKTVYPSATAEGLDDCHRYRLRNIRLRCHKCHRWMVTTKLTPQTPLLRAESPHADLCVDCLGKLDECVR